MQLLRRLQSISLSDVAVMSSSMLSVALVATSSTLLPPVREVRPVGVFKHSMSFLGPTLLSLVDSKSNNSVNGVL